MEPEKLNTVAQEIEQASSLLKDFRRDGLYMVEEITDFEAGTIKVMTPITINRARDAERPLRFMSSVNAAFRGRPMTVVFEIKADNLEECLSLYRHAAVRAAQEEVEKMEDQMRRSRILHADPFATPKIVQ